ncbi:MAG: hypothetical protein HS116_17570 [Planctomycetes bacterium]|nr:hypothetical protein [Planctomycetota bacterium]
MRASRRPQAVWTASVGLAVLLAANSAHAAYTHAWRWMKQPGVAELQTCVAEMGRVVEAHRRGLAGPSGSGDPVLAITFVEFNGRDDLAHEAFRFPGSAGVNFCDTEAQPYDRVVLACLLVARDHFPPEVLAIGSDGVWGMGAWREAAALYADILKRPPRNPVAGVINELEDERDRALDPQRYAEEWVPEAPKPVWMKLLVAAAAILILWVLLKRR